jgi:hypothetical protein
MAREKATITLDRAKVGRASGLTGGGSMSDVIDRALDLLISTEQLRHDVAAYRSQPLGADELSFTDLSVVLDLADEAIDYETLYGARE